MAYTLSFTVDEFVVSGDQVSGVTVTVQPTVYTVTVSTGPITIGTGYDTKDGSGDPNGVVTSDFKGQLYFDNDSGLVYVASAAASTSWIEILRNF